MSDELYGTVDVDDEIYGTEPMEIGSGEVDAMVEAGWHLRQLRKLRNKRADVNDLYDREMSRLVEWRDREIGKLNDRIAWHEAPLRQLSERLNEADPNRKTINLPDGALKLRTYSKPKAVVDDEAGLLEWAKGNAQRLLPEPKRIAVSDLRRETTVDQSGKVVYTATGEIVPHVHGEVPPASWTCDTDTGSEF